MRTSRISQDTSKIIITSSSSSTTRRTTRSTLSQFAHKASPNIKRSSSEEVLDIEDAISPTRKRQRDTPNIQNVPIKREPQRTPKKTVTVKLEIEDTIKLSPSPKKERKTRKPARQIKNEDGETVVRPPSDWREMYNLVKEMRVSGAASNAAVDTMGCDRLAQEGASPRDRRYHTLTALMLSSQTKDTINAVAMKRLQTQLPAYKAGAPVGLNLENVLAVDPNVLNEMIWVVGFHNNKTKYIKAAAEILRDQYNGDIPDTIEGLMSLPGVGPKMGYLCLSSAWGRTEGIGVDVHVHRITNLWGWHKTKGPEETRIALQSWLPKELWWEINWSLVGLGQKVCLPVGRRCGDCDLGQGIV
jgi:endonuclease-3